MSKGWSENLKEPLQWLDEKLHSLGAISEGQTIRTFFVSNVKSVVNVGSVGSMIGKFLSAAGSIFIGCFRYFLFLSFS